MNYMGESEIPFCIIFTKADKISPTDLARVTAKVLQSLAKHPAAFPSVIATSAETGMGFEELRAVIAKLLDSHGN